MPETDDTTPGTNPESSSPDNAATDSAAAPRRRRRAASRPAGSPASAAGEVTEGSAPAASPDGATAHAAEGDSTAERPRRRATRKATAPAGAPDEAAAASADAAPARASRRTAASTAPEAAAPAAEEGEAPARPRRRAARKATAPAGAPEERTPVSEPAAPETPAPETAEPAAPAAEEPAARPRRRATRKATAPAGAPAAAADAGEVVVEASAPAAPVAPVAPAEEAAAAPAAEESAAPARTRRRATRKATAPAGAPAASADAGEVVVEASAPAAPAEEPAAAPAAEESAAPARTRRRATRKEAAPAEAPAASQTPAAPAEEPPAPAEEAAPARGRRPAARETTEAVAEDEPRTRGRKSAASAGGRRGRMVPTFSAGEGSRRLKPGALAPKTDGEVQTAYRGKALRDGDGWGVEIDDAYEIRGYGETVEEATAEAAAALAEAFGIPVETITVEVRAEEAAAPAAPAEEEPAPARGGRRRATRPAVAVFQPPVFQAPDPAAQAAQAADAPTAATDGLATEQDAEPDTEHGADGTEDRTPRRRRRRRGGPAEQPAAPVADEPEVESAQDSDADAEGDSDDTDTESDGEDRPSRRRRRGGRRRRRGDAADHEQDGEQDEHTSDDEDEAHEEDDSESADDRGADDNGGSSSSSRRRRRRRRRGSDAGEHDAPSGADDPERTVVKVREPRSSRLEGGTGADEVQSIKGSTRLEAKKQRRREGREQGRRRVPIITEAEFLARREAVERVMVVRQNGDRTQIGVLEDNVLVEHYVNKEQSTSYVGNVYLGKVQNVLPSMEAAFVDIGKGRNAVLYAGEVNFESLGLSGGPRRIESALKSGQPVLVQVTKDPIGHKGARLTSQVSLPGRYLVYVPEGSMTGISRKLPDTERARLKTILKKIVPEDAGVIVRTAAEGASEDELRRDVERLQAQWEEIRAKAKTGNAPTLLYGEPDMTVRVVRDIFNEDFSKVIVSGDEAWSTVHSYVSHVAPDLVDRLSRWTPEVDVFANFRIDEQLLKALDRKVWLPSGGSLVIDKTEAMVVVDVNTGKFTGQGGNLEETVTRNNLEAAEEIVRQLRLRDLGGIVVIDFIDMVLESNRDLVMRRLLECLGRDRTKHQVAEVTSLGLVQMTRKRVGQGLLESFSETCVHCNGRGVIVHMDQATTVGGGGKRKRRRGGTGAGEGAEHDHEVLTDAAQDGETGDEQGDELPELEPIEVGESDLVPSVGDPEEEWFGSAAEAEAAANSSRGRGGRRRGARKATAPAGAPAPADHEPEPAVVVVPVSEPDSEPPAPQAAEPEVSAEPPARTRRRATRKATAPAGAPTAAAEDSAVVVVTAEPAAAPAEPEPEAPVSAEPPVRTRRRATRKATAPAGAPADAEDAAVVVVPTAAAGAPEAEAEAEPKKRAARKAPAAKKAAAKKTAKKAATKKAAAKKTTTKKSAAKKTATAE